MELHELESESEFPLKTFTFFTIVLVKFEPSPFQVLQDNIINCTFESKISQICTKSVAWGLQHAPSRIVEEDELER